MIFAPFFFGAAWTDLEFLGAVPRRPGLNPRQLVICILCLLLLASVVVLASG
jgi:hypothetical protein